MGRIWKGGGGDLETQEGVGKERRLDLGEVARSNVGRYQTVGFV